MNSNNIYARIYLQVPYVNKDHAKENGCMYDGFKK